MWLGPKIPKIIIIDLLQMDGSMDNQLDLQKACNQKQSLTRAPDIFIRSRHDQDPSVVKTMPEFDHNDLIGRMIQFYKNQVCLLLRVE